MVHPRVCRISKYSDSGLLHGVHIHAVAVFSLTKIFIQIGPQLICDQIQNQKIVKNGQLMLVKSYSKISIR